MGKVSLPTQRVSLGGGEQGLYMPAVPPPEHDNYKDVLVAAEEIPSRRAIARALEHIQVPPSPLTPKP